MSKCDIQCWVETAEGAVPYNQSDNVPAIARAECKTHGWDMTDTHHLQGGEMCPIGRIEAATEIALEKIKEATK